MNKPVLVVMAAGMGSRYGGMKQIDPVGPNGEVIIDYSLYDAYRAGFRTVIFVIKHEIEEAFRAAIGDRISKIMEVKYAFQQLDILPTGFEVPENREKPWGTCHAVLAAKNLIDGPFAVINADDYYGVEAFQVMYDYPDKWSSRSEVFPCYYLYAQRYCSSRRWLYVVAVCLQCKIWPVPLLFHCPWLGVHGELPVAWYRPHVPLNVHRLCIQQCGLLHADVHCSY